VISSLKNGLQASRWQSWSAPQFGNEFILDAVLYQGRPVLLVGRNHYDGAPGLWICEAQRDAPVALEDWDISTVWEGNWSDADLGVVNGRLTTALTKDVAKVGKEKGYDREFALQQLIYGTAATDHPQSSRDWRFSVIRGQGWAWQFVGASPTWAKRFAWGVLLMAVTVGTAVWAWKHHLRRRSSQSVS
jgi:hypothetical protein